VRAWVGAGHYTSDSEYIMEGWRARLHACNYPTASEMVSAVSSSAHIVNSADTLNVALRAVHHF